MKATLVISGGLRLIHMIKKSRGEYYKARQDMDTKVCMRVPDLKKIQIHDIQEAFIEARYGY